ncbi:programmed cell death protein 7-like isoform X2 [Corticium candelabrum]|uniref:programmed cell death protein 7-like isoform X2 n=1 Tax=Corticium candelabrum TaxID=121492 RepID=UPI002E26B80D|nr:programmed cell death protein 7-like isoform X2 [Corticium candelabrum]
MYLFICFMVCLSHFCCLCFEFVIIDFGFRETAMGAELLILADAKELVGQAFELLGLLRQLNDEMANDINMADDEWKESVARAASVQESLVSVQAQINDPVVQASLETQIDKKRNRRAYLKRRRKRKWEEKREQSAKSQQLHQEIDEWRAKLIAADIASKRESELRLEAGETLTEVKAKQREADKMKQLLESLKELRAHRLESAQKRGEKFTEETKVFEERVKKLESLILRQQETYQSEEKTLRTLMEEEGEVVEQEQLKLVREVAKQEETSVSHGEDPMKEFVEYYSQADRYLDSFIGIRHWWDSFVVPSEIPGGSRIPDGSIEAVEPSTKAWEQYLSTDKDKLNCAVEERQQ